MDTRGWKGGMSRKVGTDISTLLCVKWVTNETLLQGTGNSVYSALCRGLNGKEVLPQGDTRIQIDDLLCCTVESNTTS